MHVDKRIEVDIAVEVHAWPARGQIVRGKGQFEDALDAPIVPEILQ